jgi:hypothetical protein
LEGRTMIRDADGVELTYWPVTGLRAGEDSPPLNIFVDTPQVGRLRASEHEHLTIWGRPAGLGGPYTDLTHTGLDLAMLAGPETEFEIYAAASSAVTAVERVALTVGVMFSRPAGWLL